MRTGRPLCLIAAIFFLLILLWNALPKPDPPDPVSDGQQVCLRGLLQKRERKNGHLIYHLKYVSFSIMDGHQAVLPVGSDRFDPLNNAENKRGKVICYMSDPEDASPIGSRMEVSGRVRFFSHAENEGQFDESGYYCGMGYCFRLMDSRVRFCRGNTRGLWERMARIREDCASYYGRVLGKEKGSVLAAMILGQRSQMDADIKELYRQNGIAHILAISGLHISLLGLGLYRLLRRSGLPIGLCFAAGCVLLTFYGLLVGLSASVVRAGIMLTLFLLADLCDRSYDMLSAMALSGLVLLCIRKDYLTDAGFLLSFGAVLGIGLISPGIYELICPGKMSGIRFKVSSAVSATLGVSFATLPILLYYYYEYPIYSVVLNLLLVPMMSVVLVSGVAGGIIRLPLLLYPAGVVLNVYEKVCRLCVLLPHHTLITGRPGRGRILLYYGLLASFILVGKKIRSRREEKLFGLKRENAARAAQAAGFILALILILIPKRPVECVDMLSVGQGDCVVIRDAEGHVIISDAGSSDVSQAGRYRLIPYLKYNGIGKVDGVYLSHPHADHYSALMELYEQCRQTGIGVGDLYVSPLTGEDEACWMLFDAVKKAGAEVRVLSPGQRQRVGRIETLVLYPDASERREDVNDRSMVIYVRIGEFDMLLDGDATSLTDEAVLSAMKKEGIHSVSCFKAEHHGSGMANSERLLTFLQSDIALISCGEGNSYGHPHRETLDRMEKCGIRYYVTKDLGQIRVLLKKNGFSVLSYRNTGGRLKIAK